MSVLSKSKTISCRGSRCACRKISTSVRSTAASSRMIFLYRSFSPNFAAPSSIRRHQLARQYLNNSVLELSEAAHLLGYNDANLGGSDNRPGAAGLNSRPEHSDAGGLLLREVEKRTHPIMGDFLSAGRGEGRTLRGQYMVNDLSRRLRCSDQTARVQYLLCRNREVLHTSALFGNVEGQRLRRRAAAGILHVVHLAGRGCERLACLQGHGGLALNLQDHRALLDIHDLVARLSVLAALCAGWHDTLHQDGFPPRRALQCRSLQHGASFQTVLGAQHRATQQPQRDAHYQCDPNQKINALHGGSFHKSAHTNTEDRCIVNRAFTNDRSSGG